MDTASQFSERIKSLIATVAGAVIYALLGLMIASPERSIRLIVAFLLGWGMIPVLLVYDPDAAQVGLLMVVLAGIGWIVFQLWHTKEYLRPFIVGIFILNSLSFMAVFASACKHLIDL